MTTPTGCPLRRTRSRPTGRRRPRPARRTPERETGSLSLELAVLAPALLLLIFAIVQVGLWWYARSLALAAAQEGARAASAYDAPASAGTARAHVFLQQQAGDSLTETSVTSAGSTAQQVRIEVSGQALSVLPGVAGTRITQHATSPRERFTDPAPQGTP